MKLHAFVLVFVRKEEWELIGEDSIYRLIDPYYPHGDQMGCEFEDERRLTPHTGIGRVDMIIPGGVFRDVLRGAPPARLPHESDAFPEAEAWEVLPPGTTCFAMITGEGWWIECYQAESTVLVQEDGEELVSVNPPGRLTRMQVKWRHYVADRARRAANDVIVPCDAVLRLEPSIVLARRECTTGSPGDHDAIAP